MDRKTWLIAGALALIVLAFVWWMVPPAPEEAEPAQAASRPSTGEVPISADQATALALRFAAAEKAQAIPVATLPAMIVPPPNARVAVAAQLPGIVTRVFVVEGQSVRAGQALATVSSRDMVGLSAALSRAQARLGVARAAAARTAQLSREGIIAPARADEANALLREAQVDVSEQSRLVGMTNGASGSGYTLTAPIGGRISAMTIETGKALDPGAAPFVIDGTGAYQAQAQLPERLIGAIAPGMAVSAGEGIEGKVLSVGTSIDPATRSATLVASLPDNPAIRAGQALSLAILGPAPEGAVQVPGNAVAQIDGESIVFVKTGKGVALRRVTLAEGIGPEGARVVLSGLKPGEQVAITALSELRSLAAPE